MLMHVVTSVCQSEIDEGMMMMMPAYGRYPYHMTFLLSVLRAEHCGQPEAVFVVADILTFYLLEIVN
jgi:hypothetical protein